MIVIRGGGYVPYSRLFLLAPMTALLLESEDPFPIVLHADDRPTILLRLVVERLGESADLGFLQPCAGP